MLLSLFRKRAPMILGLRFHFQFQNAYAPVCPWSYQLLISLNFSTNRRWPQVFKQCKTTSIFEKWEDDPNFPKMEDNLNFSKNGRRPQLFNKQKMTSSFPTMQDDLNFWKMGRRPQFSKIEDHINFSKIRAGRTVVFWVEYRLNFYLVTASPSCSWAWHSSAPACLFTFVLWLANILRGSPDCDCLYCSKG